MRGAAAAEGGLSPLDRSVIIACGNLIAKESGYLLVKESKSSARFRYNLPAGKPQVGESLTTTAVREAREETGLEVVVDFLVGIYQIPRTSEGFGVVNFVFASTGVGGELTTSHEHPEVRFFTRAEIAGLAATNMIRGQHIERAIQDYEDGARLPLSLIQLVGRSLPPTDEGSDGRAGT